MTTSSSAKYARLMLILEDIMVVYREKTTLLVHRYMTAGNISARRRMTTLDASVCLKKFQIKRTT